MNSRADQKQQEKAAVLSSATVKDGFDFDLWAVAVKQQMIASLRKRGEQ